MNSSASASALPQGFPTHALVIDDDTMMQEMIGDLLRDVGVARVSHAGDGTAGLGVLERTRPDLVVCDLNMPGCDGFQFMEKLAARGFAGRILLVSGMNARTLHSAGLMARFHRLNVIGSLTKPLDRGALRAALATTRAA